MPSAVSEQVVLGAVLPTVSGIRAYQRTTLAAVAGHGSQRFAQRGCVHGWVMTQQVDVGEVPPAGVDGSALDGGDDLLGVHHGQRVADEVDGVALVQQ
jgi:hypothetical protein